MRTNTSNESGARASSLFEPVSPDGHQDGQQQLEEQREADAPIEAPLNAVDGAAPAMRVDVAAAERRNARRVAADERQAEQTEQARQTEQANNDNAEPPPDMFDESTQDDDLQSVEADFIPVPELQDAAAPLEHQIDEFQEDSLRAQHAFEEAVVADGAGNEEEAMRLYTRAAKIAETAREWHLAAVACRQVGDFLVEPAPPYDLERGFRMYRRAIASYESCGLFAEARELAYRQMTLKMRRGRELKLPPLHRAMLWLEWATAGFGYRPLRVIGSNLVIVLLYALIYWATSGVIHNSGTTLEAGPLANFRNAVYFSGVTFATVGYGDYLPAEHTRLLALSEGFVGAFMMGFFVAVLANRLSKS